MDSKVTVEKEGEGADRPHQVAIGSAEEGGEGHQNLLAENAQLKAVVEGQDKQMKVLNKENRKLRRNLKTAKQMFKNEWTKRERKWKRMREELRKLKEEEQLLVEMAKGLGKALGLENTLAGVKLAESRQLTTKLDQMKSGKLKVKLIPKKDDKVIGKGRRMDAVAILPEEVWETIFGHVSDPRDRWNLCNTCQLFDAILSPWKTGWMLEQALPYLYQHIPGNKLLESRLVCKSWKGAVDHFLDDHSSLRPHDPENCEPRRLDFVNPMMEKEIGGSYKVTLCNYTDKSTFDDTNKWTGTIGRSLTLEFMYDKRRMSENDRRELPQLWTKFSQYLTPFGKDIWYLNVSYWYSSDDEDDQSMEWQQQLLPFLTVDLFRTFPELRRLRLNYLRDPSDETINPELLSIAPKLETFESDCWDSGFSTPILTRYHLQLRRVSVSIRTWKEVTSLSWPNLTELHLYDFKEAENFQDLWTGLRMPQLTKLGVSFANVDFPIILGVLRGLSAIAPLNSVRIDELMGWGTITLQPNRQRYTLSNVKTLELDHFSLSTYDFLLDSFPLLENLNLFIRKSTIHNGGDSEIEMDLLPGLECQWMKKEWLERKEQEILEVNKYIYDGQMYKSNIWELMPLLKVFTFQWDVYTRHEYEAYLQGKATGAEPK